MRRRLQEAALELYLEHGYEQTTTENIASRAGVTERTFFRHFADKREVFFDGEEELSGVLVGALAEVPAGIKPLPALLIAFHGSVALFERNRPVTEPRSKVMETSPALQERGLAKNASIVRILIEALCARGTDEEQARLCAQVGMDTCAIAVRRWMRDPSDDLHTHLDRAFRDLRLASAALK